MVLAANTPQTAATTRSPLKLARMRPATAGKSLNCQRKRVPARAAKQ
jgi:hypothetical protein